MVQTHQTPWIICSRPNPRARLRLFCFPYAGGGASAFYTWSAALPEDIEVCAIQPPGRENRLRESAFVRLTSLVQALAEALQPYLNMSFAFFGHSVGALVSFELARCLRRSGLGPAHLFVSGHGAPQRPNSKPFIHELPETEFMEELRRFNGTPEEVLQSSEWMQLLIPLLRADFAINGTYAYTHEAPLDCSIAAFGGLHDAIVSCEDIAAWREQTRKAFTLRLFPGDHFFLHSARVMLLQIISRDLRQLLSQMPGRLNEID